MKRKLLNLQTSAMLLIAFLFMNTGVYSANFTAVASGNWSSTSTWGGIMPSFTNTADVITIPAGFSVALDNNLTINGAGASLEVAGTLTSSLTTNITVVLGTVSGVGSINIGNLVLNQLALFSFSGTLVVENLTTAIINLQSTATITANKMLTLTAGTLTIVNAGKITMGTNSEVVMAGGLLSTNGGLLVLTNMYSVNYTAASNIVAGLELSGTGLQNVSLNMASASNTVSLATNLTVNGILSLNSGSLVLGLSDLTIAGDIATNGTGKIMSTSASSVTINSTNGITGTLNFGNASINNLILNVGQVNHATIKGALDVKGSLELTSGMLVLDSANLKITGNIAATGTGTINSAGTGSVYVDMLTAPVGVLRFHSSAIIKTMTVNIRNSGTIKTGTDVTVKDTFTFVKGKLDVGVYRLSMTTNAIITGADSNAYVITGLGGYITMPLTATSILPKMYPVGTATAYFPATILLNTGSNTGIISVGVNPHVYASGTTGENLSLTRHVVDATWYVGTDITTNLNMNMNVMWSAAAEVNGFARSLAYLSHYTNNQWDLNAVAVATLNVNGLFSLPRNNISSLSPFAVFDNKPLSTQNVSTQQIFGVYPNPATETITIDYANNALEPIHADIVNISGEIVASSILTDGKGSISLSNLTEGVYFVKLYNAQINEVKKIVKM